MTRRDFSGTLRTISGTPGHKYNFRDNPAESGTVGNYAPIRGKRGLVIDAFLGPNTLEISKTRSPINS